MLASSVATPAAPSPDARPRLFIPSLPTLDPLQLLPSWEPRRRHIYPLSQLETPSAQLFYLARAGVYHTIKHWLGDDRERRPARGASKVRCGLPPAGRAGRGDERRRRHR